MRPGGGYRGGRGSRRGLCPSCCFARRRPDHSHYSFYFAFSVLDLNMMWTYLLGQLVSRADGLAGWGGGGRKGWVAGAL